MKLRYFSCFFLAPVAETFCIVLFPTSSSLLTLQAEQTLQFQHETDDSCLNPNRLRFTPSVRGNAERFSGRRVPQFTDSMTSVSLVRFPQKKWPVMEPPLTTHLWIDAFCRSCTWVTWPVWDERRPKLGYFCATILVFSCLQEQLGAAEGKVSRCGSLSAQQRDGGVLRPGPPAASAPQHQRSPGQGLHHEARHQLPAHTQAAHHQYVLEIHTSDYYWIIPWANVS